MVVPAELPNPNTISHSNVDVHGNLLREYEQKFAQLPEHQKLTKLCSDAGFLKNIGKGQFFITLEEESPDDMQTFESTHYLEIRKHPEREGGFVETRRSAQSWM